jgi:hypothetical protein
VSHCVTIRTQVRDPAAVAAACARLSLPPPAAGTHDFFSGRAEGLAVHLEGWVYPVVCQTEAGELCYDDYGGRWGDRGRLDEFLQMYAVEKAKIEARRRGHAVEEQALADGSVKLTIRVGGGA